MNPYKKLLTLVLLVAVSGAMAEDGVSKKNNAQSEEEAAARELANPNTAYASLNFKFQNFSGYESGGSSFNTTFQPGLPFPLDNGDKVIFRPAISYMSNDFNIKGQKVDSGVSDISFDLAYATSFAGDPTNLMAVGVFATVPTGSESLTGDQFAAGPELFLAKLSSKRIVGTLNTHQWGIKNNGTKEDVNRTGIQILWVEIASGGWTYGSTPQMSYDWNTNQAEIPLNLMVSKTTMISGRPWKFSIEANYYLEKDEKSRPDFMLGFNVSPVVENKLARLF
ncbi:conserved exported hypothetical protein [Vibrio chagasii]|uniref:hypothetical protein n=1 Tax=Vibrio coralliirubri TaxID=1516159 RepID=UPI0006300AFE|nr:hypothetical protein [Vibrio coralliirubri]CAH7021379.1 conserved exported hypothetical protein [Vibrio chagasii]CAH7293170.1 conserved exported hypothetical protein [Vibrio chagasii]CDT12376.1 conserved exported hypothetical protein [Vibrio coralliirubri]CDT30992.1 conserved exported hypothetical protein [Vibrio coralliirubri]CDT48712.1 conserved exported hypothetical protein [Vibrio coralliirubri]